MKRQQVFLIFFNPWPFSPSVSWKVFFTQTIINYNWKYTIIKGNYGVFAFHNKKGMNIGGRLFIPLQV